MSWEPIYALTDGGFKAELPPGSYNIGEPKHMLLPGIYQIIKDLHDGVFKQEDMICSKHTYVWSSILLSSVIPNEKMIETPFTSPTGVVSIMSSDIVRPEFRKTRNILIDNKAEIQYVEERDFINIYGSIPCIAVSWKDKQAFYVTLNTVHTSY
jgi:hypothetical protein